MNLNGKWELVFDPQNVGKKQNWFKRFPRSQAVTVPHVWEQVRPGYDGVGWYRREFIAPVDWHGRRIVVRFAAVQYFCEVWLNGTQLGDHEGGYGPFEFDISRRMRTGSNELVVRVINPPLNHEIEGFRCGAPLNQGNIPIGKSSWYYNFGGIWQDVSLVVTDQVAIADIYVKPFPFRKRAFVQVTVQNGGRAGKFELTCLGTRRQVQLRTGVNTVELPVKFDKVRFWSPDDPYLYTATVEIAGHDRQSVRFGMREFTVKNGQFVLNGQPIVLKGFLQQGCYPRTLVYPETRELARHEFAMLKKNGFNFMRAHLQPPPPWYLDMADEMGILIEAEPPVGWIINSPQTEARCLREVEALIRRDRNHPSIVFWCLLNEAYHFLGFTIPQVVEMTTRVGNRARKLDPTRLMIDTSGGAGMAPVGTKDDKHSGCASIMLPNTTRRAEIVDAHAYCPLPPTDAALAAYRNYGYPGRVCFVSEYGAPETPPQYRGVLRKYRPAERKLGLEDYRLHKDFYDSLCHQFAQAKLKPVFGTVERLIDEVNEVRADEMRLVTAAMRANPRLGGYAFCQLADASGELFGVTDIWREPKPALAALIAASRVPLLVPAVERRVLAAGEELEFSATLVNESQRGARYNYVIQIGPRIRITGTVRATAAVQPVVNRKIKLDLPAGSYRVVATLAGRREEVEFLVVEHGRLTVPRVATHGITGLDVKTDIFGNNYRNKNVPLLMDLRHGFTNRALLAENFGQVKKIVQLGGCAVLFEPEVMPLYEHLFPTLLRMQPVMRTISYVRQHPIFAGLPVNQVAGYAYATVHPDKLERGADVVAAGGETLFGSLSMHMWTRPANYAWGAGLYTVPIGRGQVVVCHLKVLENLRRCRVADRLLINLITYAASRIRHGGETKLLSRCIDPLEK